MLQTTQGARDLRAREARIRRFLRQDGYRLTKCRRGYGGYAVIDADRNFLMIGLSPDGRGYDASLDDVEEWMAA